MTSAAATAVVLILASVYLAAAVPCDRCDGISCGSHGACANSTGFCSCDPDWLGANCEFRNLCTGVHCYGHGVCDPNSGQCTCIGPYIGQACQSEDLCYNVPCHNGGTCAAQTGLCECTGLYAGLSCGWLTCGIHGAYNGATNECRCDRGWSGTSCSQCDPQGVEGAGSLWVCRPDGRGGYLLDSLPEDDVPDASPQIPRTNDIIWPNATGTDGNHYDCGCNRVTEGSLARPMDRTNQANSRLSGGEVTAIIVGVISGIVILIVAIWLCAVIAQRSQPPRPAKGHRTSHRKNSLFKLP